jgi:hypothetical protein
VLLWGSSTVTVMCRSDNAVVRYCAVQYGTVRYDTVAYSTVRYGAVPNIAYKQWPY